ncbi:PulJ/GspJ family protein [Phragmitibacter flavus]|nr:prepilin-type N-terminal cleavage/methylation domain-containing protein [Phragmitibacter flavus]
MNHHRPASTHRRAFTLIELLIVMAILGMLVLLMSQLLNDTLSVTGRGNQRIDADSEARLVLDRIGIDIARMVKRPDIDYYLQKTSGDDQLAFFSESTGYYPDGIESETPKGTASLIGYRIENQKLERLSKALIWNGVNTSTPGATGISAQNKPMIYGIGATPGEVLLNSYTINGGGGSSITTTGSASDPDYQVIGENVFRLEFCYLMKNGTLSDTPWLAPNTTINGLRDVAAIIVAIAVLDPASRSTLNASQLTAASAKLPNVAGTTLSSPPLPLWQTQIDNNDLDLPRSAASQVRIYQRTYHLDEAP